MEFTYFIGIDVSKNELDFAVMQGKALLFHRELENKPEVITTFLKELKLMDNFSFNNTVFCLEHTGIYSNHLLTVLDKKKAKVCLESATHIKNSLGTIRGKNDKVDAVRIAEYAYKNREELRLWQPKREVIQRLAHLSATRARLIDVQKLLTTPLKEQSKFIKKGICNENDQICQRTLNSIVADLEKAEKAIQDVIDSDPELKRLFTLVTSVKGVGKVTATQLLISTNEFKDINNPKKFACYAGVAPFTRESGLFKGRAQVSPIANKKMKMLLHMSALVAVSCDEGLKNYYLRKVEEKKNKMSILNAVRNKLIHRIFSCVNQNRKYNNIYSSELV